MGRRGGGGVGRGGGGVGEGWWELERKWSRKGQGSRRGLKADEEEMEKRGAGSRAGTGFRWHQHLPEVCRAWLEETGQCQASSTLLNPRTPIQTGLTSILHICNPGVVVLREPLTWVVNLVMVDEPRGEGM